MKTLLMLLMLSLAATTAQAEQATYYPPNIQAFVNCTSEASVWVVPDARQATLYQEARQCLDDKVADALGEAANASDLRAALKDFYLKAQTKFSGPHPRAADDEFSTARRSVFLETKLAGMANEAALKRTQ